MGKKVLLVEDEQNIILGVRTCLDAAGYEVAVVKRRGRPQFRRQENQI